MGTLQAFTCRSWLYDAVPKEEIEMVKMSENSIIEKMSFNTTQDVDYKFVRYVNSLLVRKSNRFVYSYNSNFDIAKESLSDSVGCKSPSNGIVYSSMPQGKFIVVFGNHETYSIELINYNLKNLIFYTTDIETVKRISSDYPLIEIKVFDQQEIKFRYRDLEIDSINEKMSSFKLKFINSKMADVYQQAFNH